MGFLFVGGALWEKQEKRFASSETPEFAAENIARWWKDYGEKRYPEADEILILADSGGSNGYKPYMWKFKLPHIRFISIASTRICQNKNLISFRISLFPIIFPPPCYIFWCKLWCFT